MTEDQMQALVKGCVNCGKRGPWRTEHGTGKNKAMTYELAECHHHPKPAWWRNAGPLMVAHGCGSGCQVWAPIEAHLLGEGVAHGIKVTP